MRNAPAGFFVASMLAGAYVGLGILLIFTLAPKCRTELQQARDGRDVRHCADAGHDRRRRLFTGHTMFMALRRFAAAERRRYRRSGA